MVARTRVLVTIGALIAMLATSCGRPNGLATRYAMEKALYDAQQLEHAAFATYPNDNFDAWQVAVDAYGSIVAFDLARADSAVTDDTVSFDCRRVALEARVGLLRLRHFDYRALDAVTHWCDDEPDIPRWMDVPWRPPLAHARALYDSLGADRAYEECAVLMRQIADDPVLWESPGMVRDSLLAIPLSLAELGGDDAMPAFVDVFYSRVISAWPDSASAGRSRVYRARLRAGRSRFQDALVDVDSALARIDDIPEAQRPAVFLLRAEILAFGTRHDKEGRGALRETASRFPGAREGWTARLCLALLDRDVGIARDTLFTALRALEQRDVEPGEVASRALLVHARMLAKYGAWDDAAALMWQVCARFPYTRSALSAPIYVVAHYVETGEMDDAQRVCEKASTYYLEQIARNSAMIRPRNLTKDYFIEACLVAGDGERAAGWLGAPPVSWNMDNAIVARYKSALLYNTILRDPENGVRILQKSLARFSRSRYLRATLRELDRIAPARGVEPVEKPSDGSR